MKNKTQHSGKTIPGNIVNRNAKTALMQKSRPVKPQAQTNVQQPEDHEARETESLLEKFFLDQLKDIYYAEQQLLKAIPRMEQAATTEELKEAFDDHLHQTQKQVKRLEKVFNKMEKRPEGKKCEAIEGIIKEVESIIAETPEGTMKRDAALIIAAQKIEHYEIATYGGLVQLAITIQQEEVADLLDKTLNEKEETDWLLTEIAENHINIEAEEETRYSINRNKQYRQEV